MGRPWLHIPHYAAFQSSFQATTMLFVTCIALALRVQHQLILCGYDCIGTLALTVDEAGVLSCFLHIEILHYSEDQPAVEERPSRGDFSLI